MINIIENSITHRERADLEASLLSEQFPWYFQKQMVDDSDDFFFCHNLLLRDLDSNGPGKVVSTVWDKVYPIFTRIVPHSVVYRAAFNLTFESSKGLLHSTPHRDHLFDHNNFILYINKVSQGDTHIFDDKFNEIDIIEPVPKRAVTFPGLLHAQGYCEKGEKRLVLVVTYK
ncbi:MAG: hypothetical protein ACOVR6_04630 [Fimbriimonas sp.]|jgi:hypothetical protein